MDPDVSNPYRPSRMEFYARQQALLDAERADREPSQDAREARAELEAEGVKFRAAAPDRCCERDHDGDGNCDRHPYVMTFGGMPDLPQEDELRCGKTMCQSPACRDCYPTREPGDRMPYTTAPKVRQFATGATRDLADNKLDYEGFEDPAVFQRFAEYMHTHRFQKDGAMRDSDNWQKGIPLDAYMKSLLRHVVELWAMHRGVPVARPEEGPDYSPDLEDILCAIRFNTSGYLSEILKEKRNG